MYTSCASEFLSRRRRRNSKCAKTFACVNPECPLPTRRKSIAGSSSISVSISCGAKVYKKQSPNSRLTLYLSTREFVHATSRTSVSTIDGVVLVDPAYLKDRRVYAMVLLTFRYGREDEEVMGLKFFTEAILDFKQVYPEPTTSSSGTVGTGSHGGGGGSGASDELAPLQQNLLKKLGSDAYPVTLRISCQAPPSVRLHPARPYQGSPLGVSYDLKVFIGAYHSGTWYIS